MNIVFMGTPDFAVGSLEALIEAGHTITAVVTQPDKPKGRSKQLQFSPVKECALSHGLQVFQPAKIKTPEAVTKLRKYPADVYVVAAFGQILSREILDLPRYGCLNIHASLLPKYRGASPIQHAILDGEEKTGVTIMQMDEGLDTGDMLYKKELVLSETETFETLHDKLKDIGAKAIVEALKLLEQGRLTPKKQREEDFSYASLIKKEMGKIDFSKDAQVVDRLIRGMNPWPSAYTFFRGKQMKIWKAEKVEAGQPVDSNPPGMITEVTKDYIQVACKTGAIRILELQPEGKKRMSAHDYLLGVKPSVGESLEG